MQYTPILLQSVAISPCLFHRFDRCLHNVMSTTTSCNNLQACESPTSECRRTQNCELRSASRTPSRLGEAAEAHVENYKGSVVALAGKILFEHCFGVKFYIWCTAV